MVHICEFRHVHICVNLATSIQPDRQQNGTWDMGSGQNLIYIRVLHRRRRRRSVAISGQIQAAAKRAQRKIPHRAGLKWYQTSETVDDECSNKNATASGRHPSFEYTKSPLHVVQCAQHVEESERVIFFWLSTTRTKRRHRHNFWRSRYLYNSVRKASEPATTYKHIQHAFSINYIMKLWDTFSIN